MVGRVASTEELFLKKISLAGWVVFHPVSMMRSGST